MSLSIRLLTGADLDAADVVVCLALPFLDNAATVNVAQSNEYAPDLLAHYSFTRLRVLSHMRRGHLPARDRTRLYGQVSFALG